MLDGATHFGEIAVAVPKLSDRMLAARLKELEAHGVISRTVVPATPVRIEYVLTSKGRALAPVVKALDAWANRWVPECPVMGASHRLTRKAMRRTLGARRGRP